MGKCRYYKKMRHKGYNRCLRDGSIRNNNGSRCRCPHFKKRMLDRIKEWWEAL